MRREISMGRIWEVEDEKQANEYFLEDLELERAMEEYYEAKYPAHPDNSAWQNGRLQ